jgi:hypothetical protein
MSEHEAAPERAHSRFGGSSASRWLNCPGSVALIATVPKKPSSKYADEGTAAHALAEECLITGVPDAYSLLDEAFPRGEENECKRFVVTEEMARAVQVYLDAVYAELQAAPDAELYVESKFAIRLPSDPEDQEPEVFGSNDAMVYTPSKSRLAVFDYKHGAGVDVKVEDNDQLKFYAAGAALSRPDWPIAEVELFVVQPRTREALVDEDDGVKRWRMDALDIIEFAGEVERGVAAARRMHVGNSDGGVFVASETPGEEALKVGSWCRWCPAAGVCPARETDAVRGAGLEFADIADIAPSALPKPAEMDTARIGQVLRGLDTLREWATQVEVYAFGLLQQGVSVPGFKLVEKDARRKWIDNEADIAAFLTMMHGVDPGDVMPPKLVTITEAERLLKAAIGDAKKFKEAKEDLSLRYTLKESSGLKLAPASDKREAVDAIAQDFGSVKL